MTQRSDQIKPRLLMLSHCMPDPRGGSDQARTWQLLCLVNQSYSVYLASIVDEAIDLSHWRMVNEQVEQLSLVPTGISSRIGSRCLGVFNEPAGVRIAWAGPMHKQTQPWLQDIPFDTLLCTHPGLLRQTPQLNMPLMICDLHRPMSLHHQRQSGQCPRYRRWWYRHQAHQHARFEHQATQHCHLVTLGRSGHYEPAPHTQQQTLVLPNTVDLKYFTRNKNTSVAGNKSTPQDNLVFHADWNQSSSHRSLGWFVKSIWPSIKQAVPQAQMQHTSVSTNTEAIQKLQGASIVVAPGPEPETAQRSVLQAMAMQLAVIAPQHAVNDLGVRHGEHLLLIQQEREWVDHCIESLQSAQLRLDLSRSAREFIEQHCMLDQTASQVFTRALADLHPHRHHLAQAA